MDSLTAAFADLLVDQNDRRIDDRPGIRRPSLAVIENHLATEAASNPALVGWQTFRPHDDVQADAMEAMCRGQSHRRNMVARGRPAATQVTPTPLAAPPARSEPAKLRVIAEEKPRARRTADQPLYVAKAPEEKKRAHRLPDQPLYVAKGSASKSYSRPLTISSLTSYIGHVGLPPPPAPYSKSGGLEASKWAAPQGARLANTSKSIQSLNLRSISMNC